MFDDLFLLILDGKLHQEYNIFTKEDDGQGNNSMSDLLRDGSIKNKSKG